MRNKIKLIVSKIGTAAAPILYFSTRGTAVQILKAIRFFFISRRFIYERSVTNIRDWSLAYSFIYAHFWLQAKQTLFTKKVIEYFLNLCIFSKCFYDFVVVKKEFIIYKSYTYFKLILYVIVKGKRKFFFCNYILLMCASRSDRRSNRRANKIRG